MRRTDEKHLPEDVATLIALRREILVERLEAIGKSNGLVLFDGHWVTPDQAKVQYRRMKWRGLRRMFEGILLFVMLLMATVVLIQIFMTAVGIDMDVISRIQDLSKSK